MAELSLLQKATTTKKPLFVWTSPLDVANIQASLALALRLKSDGKEPAFFISDQFAESTREYLTKVLDHYDLKYINSLKDLNYVIGINYREGGVQKVSYDDVDGKFLLYITPQQGTNFDFKNVEFQSGGNDYTAILFFGKKPSQADKLLAENSGLNNIRTTMYLDVSETDSRLFYNKEKKVIDTHDKIPLVFFYNQLFQDSNLSKTEATLLLASLFAVMDPLNAGDKTSRVSGMLSDLISQNANFSQAMRLAYYYQKPEWLDIYKEIFANVEFDSQKKILWSVVREPAKTKKYIKEKHFLRDLKLLVNFFEGVRIAFVIYYLGDGKAYGAIESNGEINLHNMFEDYQYEGTNYKGLFTVNGADADAITSLVLEKVGYRQSSSNERVSSTQLEKKSKNATIKTAHTNNSSAPSIDDDIEDVVVSKDVDNDLIEPPTVVPL